MNEKHLADISKKVHGIRKVMGYATKDQRENGYTGELKSIKCCIGDLNKRGNWIETGGFRYFLLKNGSIRISPAFNWIIKKEPK